MPFSMSTMSVARLMSFPLAFGRRTEEAQQRFKLLCGNRPASEHARTADREQVLLSGRIIGGLDGGMHGHLGTCASFGRSASPEANNALQKQVRDLKTVRARRPSRTPP